MANADAQAVFIQFATVAEQISAASSLADKATALGEYFRELRDDHLLHAVRYFTGHSHLLHERPVVPISEITLVTAISVLTRAEPSMIAAQQRNLGDLGTVAALVVARGVESVLTLEDVAIALEQIHKAKGKRKLDWVIKLLDRATPLETKYLVRLLLEDLQIGLSPEVIETAIAHMSEQPIQQVQWVHILLGDLGKTAVLAKHRHLDQARMQLFQPIKFMLASSLQHPVQIMGQLLRGFAVETKYDGIRAQVHIAPADRTINLSHETVFAGIRVAIFSRTLQEVTTSFPDLIAPLAALEPHALVKGETAGLILDGEIVAYQDEQILPVAALQQRLEVTAPSEALLAKVPVAFVAYDVLYKDGTVLLDQPYSQRRKVLESLPLEMSKVQLAVMQQLFDLDALKQHYQQAHLHGQEGLMVKVLDSLYRPGRRSHDWLKVKQAITTLDVVITAAEINPEVSEISAVQPTEQLESDPETISRTNSETNLEPVAESTSTWFTTYAVAVRASETDPTLLSLGKVSVGLTEAEQAELSDWLHLHTIEEFVDGKVCLVEPQIVLEVSFEQLQLSSRHKSGYKLLSPRILRIRQDKPANEIDTLETVQRLAEAQFQNK